MSKELAQTTHLQLLGYVPVPLRTEISRRLRVSRASKGRTLIEKGSRSTDVFFLLEGQAEVVLYSSRGKEVWVNTIGPGDVFGEMAALDGQPRSATVVALSTLSFVVMRAEDFKSCIEAAPGAALWLARRLAAGIRRLTDQVFELSALNVRSRIDRELLRLAQKGEQRDDVIEVRPSPKHAALATRIGTHREAVTKEMKALSEMGIVRYDRYRLTILDYDRLERAADR